MKMFSKEDKGLIKEWDENKLLPLKQLSAEQYRIWERKRQRNAGNRLLVIIAVYQAVLVVLLLATAKHITLAAVLILAFLCALTLGVIAFACSKRLKEIESMQIESVYRGRGMVENMSPFQIRYMDSEGDYQSKVVEKKQRRKERQGTIVDIIVENGEIVLAEKKLPE